MVLVEQRTGCPYDKGMTRIAPLVDELLADSESQHPPHHSGPIDGEVTTIASGATTITATERRSSPIRYKSVLRGPVVEGPTPAAGFMGIPFSKEYRERRDALWQEQQRLGSVKRSGGGRNGGIGNGGGDGVGPIGGTAAGCGGGGEMASEPQLGAAFTETPAGTALLWSGVLVSGGVLAEVSAVIAGQMGI